MFDFRKIDISDKERVSKALAVSDFRGCEYSFANNMAWNRLYESQISFYDDFYISCSPDGNGGVTVTFPAGVDVSSSIGREKYIDLFKKLKEFFSPKTLSVCSITKENLVWLTEYYKDAVKVSSSRDLSDYIYLSEDLKELKGKKYHGKRNHIKHFKERGYEFRLMTPYDFGACAEFAALAYNQPGHGGYSAAVEQYAIHTFFTHFETLGLKGAVLSADGKMCGFAIGEKLNSDTFVEHIEKADPDIQGAYPMLCSEFIKAAAGDLKYVNREEDLGIEGLRRSKLSYHPVFMQEKYTITFLR